ncbi:MAG: hypothetical protein AAF603_10580, partial [Pseudomonadota bacterium]
VEVSYDGGDFQTVDQFNFDSGSRTYVGDQTGQSFGEDFSTMAYNLDGEASTAQVRITMSATGNDETIQMDEIRFDGESIYTDTATDGDDLFLAVAGDDTVDGGAGSDTVDYSQMGEGVEVYLGSSMNSGGAPTQAEAGTVIKGNGNEDQLLNVENVITTDHDDYVYGNGEGNTVHLGAGDDNFNNQKSLSADDYIDGGADNDRIKAGDGDDTLIGGTGDDTLYGEDGNDLFIYGEGDGSDVIHGGSGWTDQIQIEGGLQSLGELGVDWTIEISQGSIQSQTESGIDLSQDADGVITLSDGETIEFTDIEQII